MARSSRRSLRRLGLLALGVAVARRAARARAERSEEAARLEPVDAAQPAGPAAARPEPLEPAVAAAQPARSPAPAGARLEPAAGADEAPLERLAHELAATAREDASEAPAAKRFARPPAARTTNGSSRATKADLYAQAKALGISGRSSMTKSELERAIALRLAGDATRA